MLEQIKQMLIMQDNLNNFTNGEDWKKGVTNKGKIINWHTAIMGEVAELIDSTPWKHWKNIEADSDIANIKIEVIDLFHFYMSELLRTKSVDELAFDIESQFINELRENTKFNHETLNKVAKEFALLSLLTDIKGDTYDSVIVSKVFANLMNESMLSFNDLYEIYISKNVLNVFRQNNGYKEGTYIKEWNGVEDNVVLTGIKENLSEITYDALYSGLEKAYKNINK